MKRMWTLLSSGVVFLAMVVVIAVCPVDVVIWSPGTTTDLTGTTENKPILQVGGKPATPATGQILATALDQTGRSQSLTFPRVLVDYLTSNHDVLPRDAIYLPGQVPAEADDAKLQDTATARDQALAAGVSQAGIAVTEKPKILSVRPGPASDLLFPGDFILAIDDTPMSTANDVRQYIRTKQVGDQVVVKVQRGQQTSMVTVAKLVGSSSDNTVATMNTTIGTGYWYSLSLSLNLAPNQGDSSQGLAIALTTYYLVSGANDTAGRTIAAVGKISAAGDVSAVSGINEQAQSAWNAKASVLVIPQANCPDLHGHFTGMQILPVTSLGGAVAALHDLATGGSDLPRC